MIECNSHGTNKKIKATILSDEEMREIGFTDCNPKSWYFCKSINFPKEKRYENFNITFNVTIPKDGSDIAIDILDEHFCQPYDYQRMRTLCNNPQNEIALIVQIQVEEWMSYLQEKGVLTGHRYGEYI